MSVEAPSIPSAITGAPISAPSVSVESGINSMNFGSPISITPDTGGTHSPSLNENIFSLPHLRTPNVDVIGNPDKAIGNIAFSHTKSIWQAKSVPEISEDVQVILNSITNESPIQSNFIPETIIETEQVLDIANPKKITANEPETEQTDVFSSFLTNLSASQQIVEFEENPKQAINLLALYSENQNEVSQKSEIQNLETTGLLSNTEAIADAEQAVRVKKAYITLGMNEQQAEKVAVKNLKQVLEKKNIGIVPDEPRFVKDFEANAAREKIVQNAYEAVLESKKESDNPEINGEEVAKNMPQNPQPQDAISQIIKDAPIADGSYKSFITELAANGIIYSDKHVKNLANKLINKNTAVAIGKNSSSVTDEDVKRVLGK